MGLLKQYKGYQTNQLSNLGSYLAKKKAAGMPITQRDTDLLYGSVLGGQAADYAEKAFAAQQLKKQDLRFNREFSLRSDALKSEQEAMEQAGRGNAVKGLMQTALGAKELGLLDKGTYTGAYDAVTGLFNPATTQASTYTGVGSLAYGGSGAAPVVGTGGAATVAGGNAAMPTGGYVAGQGYVADVAAGGAGTAAPASSGLLSTAGAALTPIAGGLLGGTIGRAVSPWGPEHMGGERNTAGAVAAGTGALIGAYAATGTSIGGPIGGIIGGIVGFLAGFIDW